MKSLRGHGLPMVRALLCLTACWLVVSAFHDRVCYERLKVSASACAPSRSLKSEFDGTTNPELSMLYTVFACGFPSTCTGSRHGLTQPPTPDGFPKILKFAPVL